MTTKLTPKQTKFVNQYLETGNATEAAMEAYSPKNRNTAHSIGSENLRKPAIRAYLDERAQDAAAMVYKLSQKAKNEAVRLNASKDILDRAGYAAKATLSLSHESAIIIDPEKQALANEAVNHYLSSVSQERKP